MIYLAEKAGELVPTETKARGRVSQWLLFQVGGVGPMMGQASGFYRYSPEKYQPVIDRYQNESPHSCEIVDRQLKSSERLAENYSIADIANWCWIRCYQCSGFSIDSLNDLKRWLNATDNRKACQKCIHIPPKEEEVSDLVRAEKISRFVQI